MSLRKIWLLFLVATAAMAWAPRAKADVIDPNIDFDPVICQAFFIGQPQNCAGPIHDGDSLILNPVGGGGAFQFTNETSQLWNNVLFTETGVASAGINCSSDAFFECKAIPTGGDPLSTDEQVLILFDNNGFPQSGVPIGFTVTINLNDPGSQGGHWLDPNGNPVTLTGTPNVPEPSTMMLLGTGALGTFFRRRKK